MERNPYLRAVAAVLFAAACAWLGAGIFPSLRPGPEAVTAMTEPRQKYLSLEGIALREEKALYLPEGEELPAFSGERLPAGALLTLAEGRTVKSEGSCIFLSGCDGFERLKVEDALPLSVASVQKLLEEDAGERGQARLIMGFDWYYAALCSYRGTLPKGAYELLFSGTERPVKARLMDIAPAPGGQKALIFRLPHGEAEYYALRKTTAKLILPQ